ncbi:GH3 auxin-responsive promoter-domain-containing protein [Pisolithus albus]|nr:GH3 auxin-responsive promoter-domain-containing protein [Pisolithus albus]
MYALFALVEPKLETINTLFTMMCRDLCRAIHDQLGDFIHCIETGVIPDLEGIDQVKENLQQFLQPNPDRAEELRKIGKAIETQGWFKQIWPELHVILATASGPFSTVFPEIRHYIGPNVSLETLTIASSEAFLALAYDPRDLGLYKVVGSDDVIEFLPVDEPEESRYLAQMGNVDPGKKYEVVLTTRDGFWRYRLGDVVEVIGFDPRDGQPVVRYVERRNDSLFNVHIRIANEVMTETQLPSIVDATSDLLGGVSEFCVCPDYRGSVGRYAFMVELQGNLAGDLHRLEILQFSHVVHQAYTGQQSHLSNHSHLNSSFVVAHRRNCIHFRGYLVYTGSLTCIRDHIISNATGTMSKSKPRHSLSFKVFFRSASLAMGQFIQATSPNCTALSFHCLFVDLVSSPFRYHSRFGFVFMSWTWMRDFIRTIRQITSSGSASTVFVPPLHTISSISDLPDGLNIGSNPRAPSYLLTPVLQMMMPYPTGHTHIQWPSTRKERQGTPRPGTKTKTPDKENTTTRVTRLRVFIDGVIQVTPTTPISMQNETASGHATLANTKTPDTPNASCCAFFTAVLTTINELSEAAGGLGDVLNPWNDSICDLLLEDRWTNPKAVESTMALKAADGAFLWPHCKTDPWEEMAATGVARADHIIVIVEPCALRFGVVGEGIQTNKWPLALLGHASPQNIFGQPQKISKRKKQEKIEPLYNKVLFMSAPIGISQLARVNLVHLARRASRSHVLDLAYLDDEEAKKTLTQGEYHVTIVAPENFTTFTSLLPCTGQVCGLIEPLQKITTRPHGQMIYGKAMDPAMSNTHGVPTLDHCFRLKSILDANFLPIILRLQVQLRHKQNSDTSTIMTEVQLRHEYNSDTSKTPTQVQLRRKYDSDASMTPTQVRL